MNERTPARALESAQDGAPLPPGIEQTPASYAGHTRFTTLEYEAILANATFGIAFTRDRKFFLCNPKFAQMFGWKPDELIGQPGEVVYPSRQDYEELGKIAVPLLSAGRQLDLEWEMRRKDGTTFRARMVAKPLSEVATHQGTVWIIEDISERRRQADEVARLLSEQQAILETASIGISFLRDRRVVRCNRRVEEMYGYGPGELDGRSTRLFFVDEAAYRGGSEAYERLSRGLAYSAVHDSRRKDGSVFASRVTGRAVDPAEPAKGSVWLIEDITEQQRAERELQRVLAEQTLILNSATIGIAFVRNRTFQRCNAAMGQLFGYQPDELAGQSTSVIFPSQPDFEGMGSAAYDALARGESYVVECQQKRKNGELFWCKVIGRAIDPPLPHDGSIWIYEDVTAEHSVRESLERAVSERTAELKQAEQRAQHLADHDALTGLPNRRLLEDRLTQALAQSYRHRRQTAVMFIDLDRFKTINDSLGHAAGDLLLKEIAQRLVKQLRTGDTVCRVGGDEFVVVLPELKRPSDTANVAQKLIEQLSQPVTVDDRELTITPSIGISVFPDDGRDADALLRNADAAMYHAKEMGRANYQFFTEQMNLTASRRLAVETDLRRAIAKGELRLFYQPIVALSDGRVAGHEALLRWQHPRRGVVSPAEFIQIGEDTGLILKIGEWILREACRWATFVGAERNMQVAVNLSARQFSDPKLVEQVSRALKETGLPARLLELEITESTAMQNTDVTLATLKKLKDLGVSLAIDDFGTGYSSFSYLKRFPVDKLKIDHSFIAETERDGDHRAIVAAIIALAQALGLKVVAEGVETDKQRQFLRGFGCDFIQGYLVGKPVDADSAAKDYV